MAKKKLCVICGQPYEGWGNNPDPLFHRGRACDSCDDLKVIPARLERMGYGPLHAESIGKGLHEFRLKIRGQTG